MKDCSRDPICQLMHILNTKDYISVGFLKVVTEMLQTYLLKAMAWGRVSLDNKTRSYNICYSWLVFKAFSRWNIY